MMGRQTGDQSQLFYLFNLEGRIPADHLLRRINPVVTRVLADLREKLAPFYSDIGRPSIDPELMIRMLIVGYCYGIRFERRLCEEVELHLAYRWFCRLDLDDKVPDHSTSRSIAMAASATATSCVMCSRRWCGPAWTLVWSRARASRSMPVSWRRMPAAIMARLPMRSTGPCRNARPARLPSSLPGSMTKIPDADRKLPKVISPVDPCSAWTAKANKRVQFGYGLNYLIDIENAVIVDVEATPARTYDEVAATKTMIDADRGTVGA